MEADASRFLDESRSIRKELLRRAQDYYVSSVHHIVPDKYSVTPDLDQLLKMMLVKEVQGKTKRIPQHRLYSVNDVRMTLSHPESIRRQASVLTEKLALHKVKQSAGTSSTPDTKTSTDHFPSGAVHLKQQSESGEFRRTPSPAYGKKNELKYLRNKPVKMRTFTPVLKSRKMLDSAIFRPVMSRSQTKRPSHALTNL